MKVDFHCHSTASDGTVPPAELARRAIEDGYAAFALTDHDNCDGVPALMGERRPGAATALYAGVELSIAPGEGFDVFHLLGLGVDPQCPVLASLLSKVLSGRRERNGRILANFARIGIDIPPDDIARYANGDVLARPHFARWLFEHGFAESARVAFERHLLPDSPAATRCYEERWLPSQEDAFAAVHAAGGLAIMAHPKFWRRAWKTAGSDFPAAERELARLVEAGLDGIEAIYQANSPGENVGFSRIALRLGCLASAGSDFHGSNKAGIPMGMDVDEAFIAPLLERLSVRSRRA